ncbi:MAG: histidinol-phosphatase [Bacilli bacterium]|jgi:histidinol-phosphatase (PHP family)|nr:histidinol-phosphatase [Bacilli bacterium]MCH4210760.1 histidinol-phosphatase [Bacilli bacterium]MCI2055361.1 histidinol-phosphatase [Bacilli bacterium]
MNNKPLGYTYHSHTKRCGHATGEDEDYVKKAIEGHYEILGFSDHVMLPGKSQHGMRGDYSLADGYFKSVRSLQEKYAKQLRIYCAFEAEWYGDAFKDYYEDLLSSGKVDYLLLGQHCFLNSEGGFTFYSQVSDKKKATLMYVEDLIKGMESGLFAYVAHPDLFMIWYGDWDAFAYQCSVSIIEAAKKNHMILEVNMGPSRWGRRNGGGEEIDVAYPCPNFWDIVSEYQLPCIIGVDDHHPNELLDSPFDWVRDFVQKHNLNYIDRLKIDSKYVK